jgi:DDE superfamily endonuclease/Helix-turn-helix of DDE superfamily endonuclease
MILNYNDVKEKPDTLRAMTSLNRDEFEELCQVFGEIWDEKTEQTEKDPSKGGRRPILQSPEDRLFFILFYLKTYPLQEVLAHLFGMSQGQANFLIYQLSKSLRETLQRTGHLPARIPEEMIQRLAAEGPQDLGIDGTERRIVRPKDPVRQRQFYSGKTKAHTLKSVIVGGLEDRQIKYLSDTHEGKKHDKKVGDEEQIVVPAGSDLYQDTGFQGYQVPEVTIHQPKKKPRGGELTRADKIQNRLISSVRVVIEHIIAGVKRCRIVKDVFRNTKDDYDDQVMELACGLHNFRSDHRLVCY